MQIENEIKYKIRDRKTIEDKLSKLRFKFVKNKHQKDYYFSPPHKSFAGTRKYYLRLRCQENENFFAYHVAKDNLTTEEIEVKINNCKPLLNILELLDFKLDCVVNKDRVVYVKDNIKVVLDSVENLGDFIEIEYLGKFTDSIRDRFSYLVNEFQLRKGDLISGVGYPDLLMEKYD